MVRIITHESVDLDAAGSVWAARKFIPGADKAEVIFVPANWDGKLEDGDIPVDIEAGGHGMKGELDEDGTRHSCFAYIIKYFAPHEDKVALQNITAFIDAGDATRNAVKGMAPNTSKAEQKALYSVSIGSVFMAVKKINRGDDLAVLGWLSAILDTFFENELNQLRAIEQARKIPVKDSVVISYDLSSAIRTALFEHYGARAIVFVDGNNLGVIRQDDEVVRMDHRKIWEVVEAAGETNKWFAHTAGFLFCHGSRKALAKTKSKVKPEDLANACRKALAEEDAKKK